MTNAEKITFIADKETGLIFGRFMPCKRRSDGAVGLWDTKEGKFVEILGAEGSDTDGAKVEKIQKLES